MLLPMHWPVILAGLVFGWRAGLLVGLLSPSVSHLISGMPFPPMIPGMTIELASYGFVGGFLRERIHLNALLSVLIALVVGRVVFLGSVLLMHPTSLPFAQYLQTAMVPGLAAAIAQVLTLPLLAGWWIRQSRRA
jgi:niacin transporter